MQDLVGFASDGSPLRVLFDALGPEVSQGMRDALTTALATGMGPRETARLMRRQFGVGLTRALRISRTEQLRAYREASRRNYEANSDIIDGWIWLAACDSRTCAACWAMHGRKFDVKEKPANHVQCRCVMVPSVKGFKSTIVPGAELFKEAPVATQRGALGATGYRWYADGRVKLNDFLGVRTSRQWGRQVRVRPLARVRRAAKIPADA